MKKIMYIALVMSVLFCSCESKGPKSQYYEDTRTSDEMLQVLVMDGYTNMIQMCTIWKMASGIAMAE